MSNLRTRIEDLGYRRIVHAVVVVAFLVFFLGVMGSWRLLAWVVAGWFDGALGLVDDYAKFAPHLVHEMGFALVLWPVVLGMLAQLRSPGKHLAGQLMALLPFAVLLVAFAVTDYWRPLPIVAIFGSIVLVATLLHPAGRDLVTSFETGQASTLLLVLLVVAAIPLVAFAVTQAGLQTGTVDQGDHDHGEGAAHDEVHEEHVEAGHFTLMVAFGLTSLGLGLLASLRPPGWWLPACYTGVAVAFFGAVGIAYPELASSTGQMWGGAAIGWGVAFVAAAAFTRDADTPSPYGERPTASVEQ